MLSSPQSLTVNSVATDLHRITSDKTSSTYANTDGTLEFRVSHQSAKNRARRMARLDKTVVADDPLTAEKSYQKAGVYFVIDEPSYGFTDVEVDDIVDALKGWLTSGNISAMLASRH